MPGQLASFLSIAPSTSEISHFVNDSFIVICRTAQKDIKTKWKDPDGLERSNTKGRVHIEKKPGKDNIIFKK